MYSVNLQCTMYNEGVAVGDECGGTRPATDTVFLSHRSNLLCKFAAIYVNLWSGARPATDTVLLSPRSNSIYRQTTPPKMDGVVFLLNFINIVGCGLVNKVV